MNRQFGCHTTEIDGLFQIENRYGDRYTFRITEDGERFLIQNQYGSEWNTQAIRYSRHDAEAWLRFEYSEGAAR